MNKDDLIELAQRILAGQASEEEIARYNHWFNTLKEHEEYQIDHEDLKEAALLQGIRDTLQINKRRRRIRRLTFAGAAAAMLIVCLGIGSYFLYQNHKPAAARPGNLAGKEIAPGKDQAVLTLANGNRVVLDHADIGQVAQQTGVSVMKADSGVLVYHKAAGTKTLAAIQYNELSTPRGGQYRIVLPDGTKVWLNSASAIRFPTSFNGAERDVEITGEAYFEVVHNALKPFIVTAGGVKVRVLGTHFDVNAYGDNGLIKTTLLQGSVKVTKGGRNVLIAPGEQAEIAGSRDDIVIKKVNTANVVAWTQGFLSMEGSDIKAFMASLSRWYDLDVVYKGAVPSANLGGLINRNTNLSDVLSALEAGGIHTKVEGRKIIVSN